MSENPELDYFMDESVSDVIFLVEGHTLPAMKSILSLKSKVFRAMFSGDFKESKDNKVVIEDTTYKAFKIFIRFLYCDDLVLKDEDIDGNNEYDVYDENEDKDYDMFSQLWKLCDRYDVSRLMDKMTEKLYEKCESLLNPSISSFGQAWAENQSILKFAFEFKIEKLMDKVMEFIEKRFDFFLGKYIYEEQIMFSEFNDRTDGRLFSLLFKKCREGMDAIEKINKLNECLKRVKSFNCAYCGSFNKVDSIDKSTKCRTCNRVFY